MTIICIELCMKYFLYEFFFHISLSPKYEMDYHELEASEVHTIFNPIEIFQLTTWTSNVTYSEHYYPHCFKLNRVAHNIQVHNIHHSQSSYLPIYNFVIYENNK